MASLYQDSKAKAKLGAKAPWFVKWRDPDGKQRTKSFKTKTHAKKFAAKIESDLAKSTYTGIKPCTWSDFRAELEQREFSLLKPATRLAYGFALDHFQRVIDPQDVASITSATIASYKAARMKEHGNQGAPISRATVNKELRTIRTAMNHAVRWNYVAEVPQIKFLKTPQRIPRYMTAEHFEAIYESCDVADRPDHLPYDAGTWWRAFLVFQWMTGWRRGEPLALRRSDVDLDAGYAITRAEDNKGYRDEQVPLHPMVVVHLRQLTCFSPMMFPWELSSKSLYTQFHRIQKLAGIDLECRQEHEHSESCRYYGFHDIRRAFASVTASQLDAKTLQKMMRHKSYATTQLYLNMREQLGSVVETFATPELRRKAK